MKNLKEWICAAGQAIIRVGETKLGDITYSLLTESARVGSPANIVHSTVVIQNGAPRQHAKGFYLEDLIHIARHRLNTLDPDLNDPFNRATDILLNKALETLGARKKYRTEDGTLNTPVQTILQTLLSDVESPLTDEDIRKLALANGFKFKDQGDGRMDLNPYVFEFARAIAALSAKQ